MTTIVKTIFGSHLYGTNTPNSDLDKKGILLPSKEVCFLNKIPKCFHNNTKTDSSGKNTKDDIDEEIYSLQYFFQLAQQGEMCVIDMLHSPEHCIIETSDTWKEIQNNKQRFYSKNLRSYMGYVKTQTAKYGIKGSRIASIENVLNVLSGIDGYKKVSEIWNQLPTDEYSYPCKQIVNPKSPELKHYECCGKMITETVTVDYARDILKRIYDGYGARAQLAKESSGIDWKAVSHAFRACYQIKEILETNDLKFPLKQAPELIKIKTGQYHYMNDGIAEKLETLSEEINQLALKSHLPEKLDINWFNNFILSCY